MTEHTPAPADLEELVRTAYQSAARTVRPEDLRRNSPMLAAGSVPRSRRSNMLVPFAAAAAVIAAVGASVAVPRLLTGSSGSGSGSPGASATQGISTYPPGHYPPFQVVMTANYYKNRESAMVVESAATGRVLSSVPLPSQGDMWQAVLATQDATKFVVAAAPTYSPYRPTSLYTLTLSARGAVAGLVPLAGSPLPGALESIDVSADGSTVAYVTDGVGSNTYDVGVLSGGKTRQWTVSQDKFRGGLTSISVSGDGNMLAFYTNGRPKSGVESALWVLPTSATPGSLTAAARKVHDYIWFNYSHPMTVPESTLVSPDGSEVFVATVSTSAAGKFTTNVTAYRTADGASLGTISTWDNGNLSDLMLVGGLPLIWDPLSFQPAYKKSDSTAYLLNPATRTRTTLRLRGIPRAQYVDLAW